MKVRCSFTINIDPEAWTRDYGIEGATAIREDVKQYAKIIVTEHFGGNGQLAE